MHPIRSGSEVLVNPSTLLQAIEDMEPGVVVFGPDYRIQYLGRLVTKLFDMPAEELLGARVLDFHRPDTAIRIADATRVVGDAQREVPLQLKLVTRSGVDRYLLVKLVPLLDAGRAGTSCALIYDITAIVAADRKLTRVPVSLRDEIQLLAPEEIVFVRADDIHTDVRTAQGEYLCDLSLTALEKRLATSLFFRVHRSVLVNVTCVRKVSRDRSECTVAMGSFEARLPISRERLPRFLEALGLKGPADT